MDAHELSRRMRAAAEQLARPQELDDVLMRITTSARATIPGADYVSLSVRHADGTLETRAATDPLIDEIDAIQYELREGPCYEAITDSPVLITQDLERDRRWPRFAPAALERGIRSQMGVRMSKGPRRVTGLNLYSRQSHAFDPSDGLAALFASHAGIALGYATEVASLSSALATRESIGKAIGIVMERYGLSQERAFEFLVRVSSTSNTPVRDIAAEILNQVDQSRDGAAEAL